MAHANFFVSSSGDLVRHSNCETVRARFAFQRSEIATGADLRATLRAGKFTFPGGYPLYMATSDGAALCFDCARANLREIIEEIRGNYSTGWRVVGSGVNWEDGALRCDHCGHQIPAAYGDDDESQEAPQ